MSYMNRKMIPINYYERITTCFKCKKPYIQRRKEQTPGCRERDYDICPYCDADNGSDLTYEYHNIPMSNEEIEAYNKHHKPNN